MVIGHEIRLRLKAVANLMKNLNNWWTEADKLLTKKIEAVTKQWDGIEIYGGKVSSLRSLR